MLILTSALLLSLGGCGAAVQLEEVDAFGSAWSAVWADYDVDGEYHEIIVANVGGLCGQLQEYYSVYDDLQKAYENADSEEEFCEDNKAEIEGFVRTANGLYFDGAHYLTLVVADSKGNTEPDDDTYEVGKKDSLFGTLVYYTDNPFDADFSDWDADEVNCGLDLEADTDLDVWSLSDGELEITNVADEASLHGLLDGELVDEDGDDEGDIVADITATYCEIDP